MVSDKLLWDTEPGDNLIEYKILGCLTVGFNSGHSLYPFHEIFNSHYNVMVTPTKIGLQSIKSSPDLVKGPEVMMGCNGVGFERILHANT